MAFSGHGTEGSILIRQFNDDRKEIVLKIKQFDQFIEAARKDGNTEEADAAETQRNRLVSLLETYKTKKSLSNADHFLEYPLATKEGGIVYRRRGIVKRMVQDMVTEKQRLEADINEITKLLAQKETLGEIESSIDLEILEEDLQDLHNRLNRLQIWLAQNDVNEINTNFDHWADYSGFGLSDINFSTIKEKDGKIATYSKNVVVVDEMLAKKRELLESKINHFNQQMSKIEKRMDQDRVRLEKTGTPEIFREYLLRQQRERSRKTYG